MTRVQVDTRTEGTRVQVDTCKYDKFFCAKNAVRRVVPCLCVVVLCVCVLFFVVVFLKLLSEAKLDAN